jgi:hypothetical protein
MYKSTFAKLLFLLSFAYPAFSQSARTYIVTNEGDTLYAAIRFNQRLSDNNREVFVFTNNRSLRYTPGDIKAYYNGLQEFETKHFGSAAVFLQRHTVGYASLYYCDEAVLADMIRNSPRLGDQIGYSLKDALGAAVNSVKQTDYFGGKVPVIALEGKSLRIFDPNMPKRKQELAEYFYDFPGTESLLGQEKITPETYEQLVMVYNQWKPQVMARLAEQEKTANGF